MLETETIILMVTIQHHEEAEGWLNMELWIIRMMEQLGYWGVFILILVENLFPPIPSEIILTFGGFMTTTSSLTMAGMIAVSTLGSTLGAIILYAVGRMFGVERLERIIVKWGKLLRLKPQDLHRANSWFDKYGYWAVLLCRFVPLIRSLISIPAGLAHMRIVPFVILTTIGSLIWNSVLIYLGSALGNSWDIIVDYMDMYSNVVYVLLIALFVLILIIWLRRFKRTRN